MCTENIQTETLKKKNNNNNNLLQKLSFLKAQDKQCYVFKYETWLDWKSTCELECWFCWMFSRALSLLNWMTRHYNCPGPKQSFAWNRMVCWLNWLPISRNCPRKPMCLRIMIYRLLNFQCWLVCYLLHVTSSSSEPSWQSIPPSHSQKPDTHCPESQRNDEVGQFCSSVT